MPSFKLAFLALAASLVSAQVDLSQLPTCALAPAVAALGSSGCSETDVKCICSSTSFLASLLPAIEAVCTATDVAKATSFADTLCLSVGVTLAVPGSPSTTKPAAPSTSAAAPSTTASAAPVVSSVAVSSAAGVSTVYVTVPCSTSSSAPVVVSASPVVSSNVTVVTPTKSATPSAFTGAAAAVYVSGATMFGGALAAIAMLL